MFSSLHIPFLHHNDNETPAWAPALRGLNPIPAAASYTPPPPMELHPFTIEEFHGKVEALKTRVAHRNEGFFPHSGMIHKVFGGTSPMALGLTPIFFELAHYGVGFSIAKSGSFAKMPFLRGLRTYMFSSTVGYGSVDEASKMAEFLFLIHSGIKGVVPMPIPGLDTMSYCATDPSALLWVWSTLMKSGLDAHEMFVGTLSDAERGAFYEESKTFGELFGVPREIIPENYERFLAYFRSVLKSPMIHVGPEAKETSRQLFENIPAPLRPYFIALTAATLTPELREAFDLPWNATVAKRADRAVCIVRIAYKILPERMGESPMKSVLRARMGEGDRVDALVRDFLDFTFAVGTEAKINTQRSVPLPKHEVLARSIKRIRKK